MFFLDHQHLKRKYFTPILNSKLRKATTVYNLKANTPFPELCKIIDDSSISIKAIHSYIFGNALPTSYDTLGSLDGSEYVSSSSDIITEVNWVLISIRKYKKEILLFLQYRQQFEDAFLTGNYELAEEYLLRIENEICCSLWSLGNRFLLNEFYKSPESNKAFLSEFNTINKGFFTPTLAYDLSNKSEKNFSVLKYNNDIQNQFSRFKGSLAEAHRQFYYLHLNYYENQKYSEYRDILSFDFHHSVIDRYLTLNKILKLIVSNSNTPQELLDVITSRITYLVKKFDDNYLKSVLVTVNPNQLNNHSDESFDIKVY